ncbi:unnamed protein product [Mucor hiemalis]
MQLNTVLAALLLFSIGLVSANGNPEANKADLSRRITQRFTENVKKIEKRAPATKCPYFGCLHSD